MKHPEQKHFLAETYKMIQKGLSIEESLDWILEIYVSGTGALDQRMVKCHRDGCNNFMHLADASTRIGRHNFCPRHAKLYKGKLQAKDRVDYLRDKENSWLL